jgi:Mg-chelatase subunit ChlD
VIDPKLLHFIFVLDRSGSMWGDRIVKAKEALTLFLRSLPEGCKFTVINYGSTQDYLLVKNEINVIEYNEENVLDAIRQI